MPADIRSFFGGAPKASPASQKEEKTPAKKAAPKKKPARASRVIESDDEDDFEEVKPQKPTPKQAAPKKAKKEPSPELQETTTSEFFASKNKPKRSEPVKKKITAVATSKPTPKATPVKAKAETPATGGRASARGKKAISYAETKDVDEYPDDDLDDAEDIFGADYQTKEKKDDYVEIADSDDDMPIPLPHRVSPKKSAKPQKKTKDEDDFDPEDEDVDMKDVDADDDFVIPDDDEEPVKSKPKKAVTATASRKHTAPETDDDDDDDLMIVDVKSKKPAAGGRKRKTPETDEDEEEDEAPKKGRAKKATPAKPRAKKAKKEDVEEDAGVQEIYDSIPLIRAPTPPPKDNDGKAKFNWRANAGRGEAGPAGGSSAEMPSGSETCLAGLTFVFTGVLEKWGRTEAQELVKRHGGKVTTAPSKNTSYVVLGSDAGPSKLEKIRNLNIKTINEDGLSALIEKLTASGNVGDSKAQAAHKEKLRKEEEKIKAAAEELEREEQLRLKAAAKAAAAKNRDSPASSAAQADAGPVIDSRLWTVKYAPTTLQQICGNKGTVEKLQRWLQRFPKSQKTGFKLAGPDGSGGFRAVMLHGPPGIGKTTAAHLVAKLEGYDIVESNASDTRSKKLVEEGLRGVLSTNSINGYFAGDGKKVDQTKKRVVLIMDEVDGMSAGDRGGVGALAAVCKKSEVPLILICNDRKQPKMKPFDYVTYDLPFRRPTVDQIRSRIMTIAFREGLKMPTPVVNALIEGSHADIRQVVNMISTARMDQQSMDFNKGKEMSKAWEKHVILKPWDITSKILGGGMFATSSKATLNEKIELYFNDHEFSPLMLQENYLGTNPIRAGQYSGREKNLKMLELASDAADSISDGDLVDRMIHGSQQQWSLMPVHAVFSFVRPASFVSGSMAGHQTRFTSWLGKNSNQQKLTRMVKEIQSHMRLRSSGDRHEVRQHYIPMFWDKLVKKLQDEGKEAVPELIELMDSYFLTKDDFDAIMELGVGPMDEGKVKINSQAKSTFTRLYNQASHPLPFMKASNVIAPKKAAKDKPDLEEAIEESDEGEVIDEVKEDDDATDLAKDKYIKAPKKKAAPKKAPAKPRGKKRAAEVDDDDEDEEEEVKPKGRGKAKAAPAKRGGKK